MVAVALSKIVVVTVNLIFMVFGIASLTVGVIFKLGWDEVKDAFDDSQTVKDLNLDKAGEAVGIAAITFGTFILIVSVLGCMGACCKLKPLLVIYAVIVLLLIIGQVSVVAFVAVKGSEAEDDLKEGLQDMLKDYKEDSSNSRSKAWSAIFSFGECCAVTNYMDDFKLYPFIKDTVDRQAASIKSGSAIPITCCSEFDYEHDVTPQMFRDNRNCLETPTTKNAYTEGCYTKIKDWVTKAKNVLIGVGCAILAVELILVALAFFLFCRRDD